jgi:hypothetical protein
VSASGTARAARRYILIQQLLATAGDGVRIQAEEFTQNAIAAVSQLDGLQAGEQTTLLFVEQAVESKIAALRYLESGSIGYQWNRLRGLPGSELIPSLPTIGGHVQEASGHFRAAQTSASQLVHRIDALLNGNLDGN